MRTHTHTNTHTHTHTHIYIYIYIYTHMCKPRATGETSWKLLYHFYYCFPHYTLREHTHTHTHTHTHICIYIYIYIYMHIISDNKKVFSFILSTEHQCI